MPERKLRSFAQRIARLKRNGKASSRAASAATQLRDTDDADDTSMKAHARRAVADDAAARRKPLAFVGATRKATGARLSGQKQLNPARDPATAPRAVVEEDATREAVVARRTHLEPTPEARGLRNLGNTCFLNATLQALRSVPGVAQTLGDARWPLAERGADVAAAFRAALDPAESAPRRLVKRLRRINRGFRLGRQEDAHELLRALLDASSSGFAKLDAKDKHGPVEALFEGKSTSTLTCPACGYASKTTEPFQDLSLEPLESVAGALNAWMKPEKLSASEAWRCGGCNKSVRATKALGVEAYPEALVVHLKRFRTAQLGRRHRRQPQKIEKRVAFEARWAPSKKASYDLTGVVVHHGSTTRGGHYTAYARRKGAWCHCDDASITSCKEADVLKAKAYLLFYAMRPPTQRTLSMDLPSRRKRPAPAIVRCDPSRLQVAKFRSLQAFEERFKRIVTLHGAQGLRKAEISGFVGEIKPRGPRGSALKAKSEANLARRRDTSARPRRAARNNGESKREASERYLRLANEVLSATSYEAFMDIARELLQGCSESEEFVCVEKLDALFAGHGLLKHGFNVILPGSFDVPEALQMELYGIEDFLRKRRAGSLPSSASPGRTVDASRKLGSIFAAAASSDSDDESLRDDAALSSSEDESSDDESSDDDDDADDVVRATVLERERRVARAFDADAASSSSSSELEDEDAADAGGFDASMEQQLAAARTKGAPAFEVAAARRELDEGGAAAPASAPVTAWGGFEVGGWAAAADVRAAPGPKRKRPKHRYDAWDRSLDAPRKGNWDD